MQENSAEIVIKDGIIQSPTWLVNAVDSVAQSHQKGEDYLYPSVYNIQEGTNHYILVWDLSTPTSTKDNCSIRQVESVWISPSKIGTN